MLRDSIFTGVIMRSNLTVYSIAVLMVVLFIGCGKNKRPADRMHMTGTQQDVRTATTDTTDVFNEFYMADTAGNKEQSDSKAPHVTFAPSQTGCYNTPSGTGRYVVQIACLPAERLANRLVAEMRNRHIEAYIVKVRNPSSAARGTVYRVRIGGFNHFSEANVFARRELIGYEFWVDKKAHDAVGVLDSGITDTASENGTVRYNAVPSSTSP